MTEFRIDRLVPNPDAPLSATSFSAWLALFIRVPKDLIQQLWPNESLTPVLEELEQAGLLDHGIESRATCVIALRDSQRTHQAAQAQRLWGRQQVHELHRAAAEYWLAENDPCSAVFHLEQAGELESATVLIKANWFRASFQVGDHEFRQTMRRLSQAAAGPSRAALLAVERLIGSLPMPPGSDPRLDLQLVKVTPETLASLPPGERATATAAVILALTSSNRLRQAITLGEDFVAEALDDADIWEQLPTLWNALAEAYVTAGWPKKATFYAARAGELARSQRQDFARFRSLGLQSVALALNGEYDRATDVSARARAISDAEDWPLSDAHFPLILSDTLIASARFDDAALMRTTRTLEETFPDNRLWTTTALVAEAMAQLCLNKIHEGVTLIRRVLNSTDEWGLLGMVRGFALGIHADLLLASNGAVETLTLLANAQSSLGHALCFDMQRSSAYLMMGRPGDVLHATDACIAMGQEHCLRTLPPVLFRRAIAYEQLNLPEAADKAFTEAYLLISESRSLTPLLNLPPTIIAQLWSRLRDAHPEYRDDIDDILRRANQLPGEAGEIIELPSFTSREIELASMLRTGSLPTEIASALFLSPNTVKVHLRNLYKKLGVHSRAEAVARINSLGMRTLSTASRTVS